MRFSLLNSIKDTNWWDDLRGTNSADMIEIGWGNDTASGLGGNDVIWDKDGAYSEDIWLGSDDRIFGDTGNDLIFAGWGSDLINGGIGVDTLDYRYSRTAVTVNLKLGTGSGDNDSASKGDTISNIEIVEGSHHNDTLISKTSQDLLGGSGDDRLTGGTGASDMKGNSGNDTFFVRSVSNSVDGGEGNDTVDFYALNYGIAMGYSAGREEAEAIGARLTGARSVENVLGTRFADYIELGAFSQDRRTIEGMEGDDQLIGGGGNDRLRGGTGNDTLTGNSGDDQLEGGDGNDHIEGGYGNNTLSGGNGADELFDGANTDIMNGGAGSDILYSDYGSDILTGGAGFDDFVFSRTAQYTANPTITDFNRSYDIIDLSGIDADATQSGNQTFEFVGQGESEVGTVSYEIIGNKTVITTLVDDSHNFLSDMKITLEGTYLLSASDFVL